MFKIISSGDRAILNRLFAKRRRRLGQAESTVAPIIDAVRDRGDGALLAHARRYDGLKGNTVRIPPEKLRDSLREADDDFRDALEMAAERIRQYAELQMPQPWSKRIQREHCYCHAPLLLISISPNGIIMEEVQVKTVNNMSTLCVRRAREGREWQRGGLCPAW